MDFNFKPPVMKFVTLGLYNAGKTSFLHRLENGEHNCRYIATIGAEVHIVHQDGIKLQAWDYNTRGYYRAVSRAIYRGCSGVVFMIDSADVANLNESMDYLNAIMEDELVPDVTLMVVANKQDLNNAVGPEVIEEKIKEKCKIGPGQSVFVMPMSVTAEDGHSIELALRLFLKTMKRKEEGKIKTGLIPCAWETAEKEVEDKEIDDNNPEDDGDDEDVKTKEKGGDLTTPSKETKSFWKDPVHILKSLLIH